MMRKCIRESNLERKPSRVIACASCGKQIEHHSGRRPRFCGTRCRNRENDRKRVRKARLGGDTRAPAKLEKKNRNFKALQRAKTLSSNRIFGPADVLAIEVLDRPWQQATSSGGVAIEIGRLRKRALAGQL